MRLAQTACSAALVSIAWVAPCQDSPKRSSVPIYDVTVVERTTKAINYAYRGGPTKIDFRGTILLPQAKGEAVVVSQRGRTEIEAKFENLLPTSRFGREYLTYSLWAISPEGAAHNIGEIVPDGSNKAKLRVTTNLQAFGLIVTAEPYSAVRRPSDVVVLENQVRPDTVGKVEEVNAKYELLPRGHYMWEAQAESDDNDAPKVSMNEYEALLQVYEAQNAAGIARAAGAEQFAPDALAKAQTLLEQARQLQMTKAPTSVVVETAREAAQTAEDARVLAERRRMEQRALSGERQVSEAKDAEARAQAAALEARAEADTTRAQGQADREARERAEADAAQARARLAEVAAAPPAVAPAVTADTRRAVDSQKTDLRIQLYGELNRIMATRDTPRGLVVTISDADFVRGELSGIVAAKLEDVAATLARYPDDLRLDVEGYSDSPATAELSELRAISVRRPLLNQGLATNRITARGLGDSRPAESNATLAGRIANRRVEVAINGDSIGSLPVWEHTYSIVTRR